MVITPKIRGFVCITAHPTGCAAHVNEQIKYVQSQGSITGGPKNVLVIGASTGYGLATRISAAFGAKANTLGVCFERPSENGKPASAGWYNTAAFESAAHKAGLYAKTLNGDAFSDALKEQALDCIAADMGPIDLVIYSLASPRRTDPKTGETFKSVLKPIGVPFQANNLDTDKKAITQVSLEAATSEDIHATTKVMGGEDWELWMQALQARGLLAPDCKTVAYSYIGPMVTWPIYLNGTIGKAKEDLERAAKAITQQLKPISGQAYIAVNKAVVTQASSAIPVVPLYISVLFKVMKAKGNHEGCIEQMHRLLATHLYNGHQPTVDSAGRIRMDDWEMLPQVQEAVAAIWPAVTTDSIDTQTDFKGYQAEFLKLFGFGLSGVDYAADVAVDVPWPSA